MKGGKKLRLGNRGEEKRERRLVTGPPQALVLAPRTQHRSRIFRAGTGYGEPQPTTSVLPGCIPCAWLQLQSVPARETISIVLWTPFEMRFPHRSANY